MDTWVEILISLSLTRDSIKPPGTFFVFSIWRGIRENQLNFRFGYSYFKTIIQCWNIERWSTLRRLVFYFVHPDWNRCFHQRLLLPFRYHEIPFLVDSALFEQQSQWKISTIVPVACLVVQVPVYLGHQSAPNFSIMLVGKYCCWLPWLEPKTVGTASEIVWELTKIFKGSSS